MEPTVTISGRGEERVRLGHLWVYRADVHEASAAPGDLVRVLGPRGRVVGRALYSDRLQITLRFIAVGDEPAGLPLVRDRLERAIAFRASLGIQATAYRLVHADGDLLPSLIVD